MAGYYIVYIILPKIHIKTWTASTPKNNSSTRIENFAILFLEINNETTQLEIKMENVVTYATYELISVFRFHFA